MGDAERDRMRDADAGDDVPPVLDEAVRALRRPVPVRAEWRDAVLRDIAGEPRPMSAGVVDTAGRPGARRAWSRRAWSVRPAAGIAALLLAAVMGAAGATLIAGRRAPVTTAASSPGSDAPPGFVQPVASGASVVRFAIVAEGAARVAVVGDFNRWDPTATPLQRGADGRTWAVAVPLPAGRHVYAFVVDGGLTADPSAPRAAEDDFGEPSSVVVVPESRT